MNSVDGFWIPNINGQTSEEWAWVEEEEEKEEEEKEEEEEGEEEEEESVNAEEVVENWSWTDDPSFLNDNSLSWDGGWNYRETGAPRSRG